MTRVTLIVPCKTLPQIKHLDSFENLLKSISGGYSVYSGFGEWIDADGETYREQHQRYEILVNDSLLVEQLITVLHQWGQWAGEQSVCYQVEEVSAQIEPVHALVEA